MDPRLQQDAQHLSTSDLVLCWTILSQMREYARQGGHPEMDAEFSARLRLLDAELARRQGKLFDT